MRIRNAKNWSHFSNLEACTVSIGAFLLITGVLLISGPAFYGAHPYKFYFLGGTLIAFFFGYRMSLVFVILSSIYANIFFVPPFGLFTLSYEEFERYILNLIFGAAAIILIEILQRERFKSKLLLLVSESRYLILLHRDNRLLNELKRKKS